MVKYVSCHYHLKEIRGLHSGVEDAVEPKTTSIGEQNMSHDMLNQKYINIDVQDMSQQLMKRC
jgi:hypothetical protein